VPHPEPSISSLFRLCVRSWTWSWISTGMCTPWGVRFWGVGLCGVGCRAYALKFLYSISVCAQLDPELDFDREVYPSVSPRQLG